MSHAQIVVNDETLRLFRNRATVARRKAKEFRDGQDLAIVKRTDPARPDEEELDALDRAGVSMFDVLNETDAICDHGMAMHDTVMSTTWVGQAGRNETLEVIRQIMVDASQTGMLAFNAYKSAASNRP